MDAASLKLIAKEISECSSIHVLRDEQTYGQDPLGSYLEWFWLPVIGPASFCIYRRLIQQLEARQHNFELSLLDLAMSVGLGENLGANFPLAKTLARLAFFRFATWNHVGDYAVRTTVPYMSANRVNQLPANLQSMHQRIINPTEGVPA